MAAKELFGSRKQRWHLTEGGTGTREFQAAWATWFNEVPALGSNFPGSTQLKLVETSVDPLTSDGATSYSDCKVTCEYRTYEFVDSVPVTTFEVSGEVLEIGLGRHWEDVGTYVQQSQGTVFPLLDVVIKIMLNKVPLSTILACTGKVNGFDFQGCPPQSLLYNGCAKDERYDYERRKYWYTLTHRFSFRPRGWNVQWRAPEQRRVDGVLVYDNDDQPVFVSGPRGIGGWTRMLPLLYDLADFNPLIGLPSRPIPS